MRPSALHLVAFAGFGCLVLSETAHGYCTSGKMYSAQTQWFPSCQGTVTYSPRVYLVAPTTTFVGLGRDVVAHQIQVAIDNWHEDGAAVLNPYYDGLLTSDPG